MVAEYEQKTLTMEIWRIDDCGRSNGEWIFDLKYISIVRNAKTQAGLAKRQTV